MFPTAAAINFDVRTGAIATVPVAGADYFRDLWSLERSQLDESLRLVPLDEWFEQLHNDSLRALVATRLAQGSPSAVSQVLARDPDSFQFDSAPLAEWIHGHGPSPTECPTNAISLADCLNKRLTIKEHRFVLYDPKTSAVLESEPSRSPIDADPVKISLIDMQDITVEKEPK